MIDIQISKKDLELVTEIVKTFAIIVSPFIAAFLAFKLSNKSKSRDILHLKEMELNNVLSNLLLVWDYLRRIKVISQMKYDENFKTPIPRDFLPLITLSSGQLNDGCFVELDSSVQELKKYDPIVFYELEGIGRSSNYIQKNFIIPFIKNGTDPQFIKNTSSKYIDSLLDDFTNHISSVSTRLDKEIKSDIANRLKKNLEIDFLEVKEEMTNEYYDMLVKLKPDFDLTREEFVIQIEDENFQNELNQQFEMIKHIDLTSLIEIAAANPTATYEEAAATFIEMKIINSFNIENNQPPSH